MICAGVLECWSVGAPGSGGYLVFVGLGVVLLVFARRVLGIISTNDAM